MAWHATLYDGKLGATAQDDRQLIEASLGGVGAIDLGDLLVSAGSGLNSQIAAGRATIRNTYQTTQGGLYLVRNDAAVVYSHAAADPTNPRIDQILAKVYDSESGGDASDQPSGLIVPGTATGGATLDNRTGAGSLAAFNNYILLSDALVPAGAGSAASFTYRDRRPLATPVVPPSVKTALNASAMTAHSSLPTGIVTTPGITSLNSSQVAYAAYLPRRVVNATKIRWAYVGNAAQTGTYNAAIFDASGRLIVSTGSIAFVASATLQARAETIATTTFEAGIYYVFWGQTGASSNNIVFLGMGGTTPMQFAALPNVLLYSLSGGTTVPTTILGFTDAAVTVSSGLNAPLLAVSQ